MSMPAQKEVEILKLPPYITVPDCVKYFGLPPRMTWRLARLGLIKASRVGKYWRIRSISVLRYMKDHENKAPEPTMEAA